MSSAPVSPEAFRDATRLLAGHVAVVATLGRGGAPHAITATSWTWVSIDPPLVLVCLHEDARVTEAVEESGTFALSALGADAASAATARWLATGGRPSLGQLDRVPHAPGPVTGDPLVDGALLALECTVAARHAGGDHVIVVGEVVGMRAHDPAGGAALRPLLYSGREYHTLAPVRP